MCAAHVRKRVSARCFVLQVYCIEIKGHDSRTEQLDFLSLKSIGFSTRMHSRKYMLYFKAKINFPLISMEMIIWKLLANWKTLFLQYPKVIFCHSKTRYFQFPLFYL